MTEKDGPRRVTRYSVWPPSRFVGKGADFRLWIQRVELHFREADVPRDKRGQELASLLDDEPFRIVSQMGLLWVDSGIDYAAVKECLEKQFAPSGLQLEWQHKFHTGQQEQAKSLIAFSARLRESRQGHARSEVRDGNAENRATYIGLGIVRNGAVIKPRETGETVMLVDTGSSVTILHENIWKKAVKGKKELKQATCPVMAVNGESLPLCGQAEVTLQQCLLGTDFLEQCHCVINMGTRTLTMAGVKQQVPLLGGVRGIACHMAVQETTVIPPFHQVRLPVRLETDSDVFKDGKGLFEPKPVFSDDHSGLLVAHSVSYVSSQGDTVIQLMNVTSTPISVYAGEKVGVLSELQEENSANTVKMSGNGQPVAARNAIHKSIGVLLSDTEGLTTGEREKTSLLQTLGVVISVGDGDLGRTSVLRHKIDTGSIWQQSRRLPFHQRGVVKDMIDGMLKQGIIEPSEGAWASPIVLARKKDGSFRFCVDFRCVNDVTKKDVHPLPRIDDALDSLAGAKWFSTLDLACGYWQFDKVFVVDTDASQHGLGAALSQEGDHVIAYASRVLTKAERQYCATRKEMLGMTSTPPPGLPDAVKEGGSGDGAALLQEGSVCFLSVENPKQLQDKGADLRQDGSKCVQTLWSQKDHLVLDGGLRKTLEKVRSRFYWPGQRHDVVNWCKAYAECASRKSPTRRRRAPMQSGLVGTPMQRVAMDILGPLPVTARENNIAAVENERDWDLHVPLLMLAYRTSTQESTRCTPFYLMFGREARLPADVMSGLPPNFPPQQVNEYALDLRTRLEGAWCGITWEFSTSVKRLSVPRGKSPKLHCYWQGPYSVVTTLGDALFLIQHRDSPRKRTVVHFDRLKPCTVRSSEENVAPASNEKTRVPAGPRSVLNNNGET
eukprot:Em0003g170a